MSFIILFDPYTVHHYNAKTLQIQLTNCPLCIYLICHLLFIIPPNLQYIQEPVTTRRKFMDSHIATQASLQGLRPQEYPTIDIPPVFIQYMFSFVVILLINCVALYQFTLEMWRIYSQPDLESIIHDFYDKTILHTSVKYASLNIICVIYFHDITSPPIQLLRIFWLYFLCIVFLKFDFKEVVFPAIGFICGLTGLAWLYISIYQELPAFKLIVIEVLLIVYFGATQAFRITKILSIHNKDNKKRAQLSVESLLQKNSLVKSQKQYDSLLMNTQLDENVIGHLQNRRSFCIVLSCALVLDIILLFDLEASKQLLGQVLLSVVLDILPLYVVFWYLRKSGKQQQQAIKRNSHQSQTSYRQTTDHRKSNIVIEMVNLKG